MTDELELQTIAPEDLEDVNAGYLRYAAPVARGVMTGLRYGATGLKYGVKGIVIGSGYLMTGLGVLYAGSMLKGMYDYGKEKITGVKPGSEPPEIVE